MKKRIISLVLIVVLAMSLIVGCGSKENSGENGKVKNVKIGVRLRIIVIIILQKNFRYLLNTRQHRLEIMRLICRQ